MNRRLLLTASLVALIALGSAMTLGIKGTRAQPLPLDECISVGVAGPLTRLCMHQFSDHSKCVVAVTPGTEFSSTQLSCKITWGADVGLNYGLGQPCATVPRR